ncbi:hypothetical protein CEE45_01490 [Candidatus Heimdallarchaeota archaeon B3_Heim]|nr:MAG: hypothetical protein CEE45_01490 [Candidatus Heimdallarchaeota archaeon B3_Heim]
MMQQELFTDLETFYYSLIAMIQENAVPLIIGFAFLCYFGANQWRKSRDSQLRNVREHWKAITSKATKISSAFKGRIGLVETAGTMELEGDIYLIDSVTNDELIDSERVTALRLELTQEQILPNLAENEICFEKYEFRARKENKDGLRIDITKGSLQEQLQLRFKDEKEEKFRKPGNWELKDRWIVKKFTRVLPTKNDTYVSLRKTPKGGEIIAFRRQGIQEHETILSEATPLPLIDLDPNVTKGHLQLAMFGLIIYEFLLMYTIFAELDPTFLLDRATIPWYFVLVVAFVGKYWVDKTKIAYFAYYRAYSGAEETFKLRGVAGEISTYTTKVFEIELHAHPAIPLANLLKFNPEDIKDERISGLEQRVTNLSAKLASAKSKHDQLLSILQHKDQQLDQSREKHIEAFDDGAIFALTTYRVKQLEDDGKTPQEYVQKQQGTDTLTWFKEIKPLLFLIVIGVGAFFLITNFLQWFQEIQLGGTGEIFSTQFILGLIVLSIILFFLLRSSK